MFKYEHMHEEGLLSADPRLARQSLARELSQDEIEFARVLEEIFATGRHSFEAVAAELRLRGTTLPSGDAVPWSEAVLTSELALINQSLDAAYASAGIGS